MSLDILFIINGDHRGGVWLRQGLKWPFGLVCSLCTTLRQKRLTWAVSLLIRPIQIHFSQGQDDESSQLFEISEEPSPRLPNCAS